MIEKHDDAIIYNVTFPMECATFCVNEQRFICNSFDFCSNECRLSRAHIGDGSTVVDSKTCDHFSSKYRTFTGLCLDSHELNSASSGIRTRELVI